MSNQHISQFLDYYCSDKLSNPQYAVLLKGKWGSGKTHFINEYKEHLKTNSKKYIYVSLYGVTSYDEIETKFLQSSNPEIFNEKSIFAGKLADAFINENIKKSLGQIKKTLSSLNAKGNILIFDDLERCNINIVDLLGYINNFVEHQSYKVILIANEEELIKNVKEVEKTEKYTLIKEKLIGKTFEFISDASSAYDSFLNDELENANNIKEDILEKYKDKILEIFKKSQCNNLRILRQGLFDFERLYDLVFINHISKDKLIDEIINIFFILIFEIKSGESRFFIKLQNDKGKAWNKHFEKAFNTKITEDKNIEKNEKTVYEIILSKYGFSLENNMILSLETWQEIIENSYIDIDKIDFELKNSKYYFNENTPSWKKLTNYYNLEDNEFDKLLKNVYEKFSNKEYKDYKQFNLVASMLLYFQEKKLFIIKFEELFNLIKMNFNSLFEEGSFDFKNIFLIRKEFMGNNYENSSYLDSKSFETFEKYIIDFLKKQEISNLKNDSKLIIDAIKEKNSEKLFELLEGKNDIRVFDYKDKPILSQININDLFNALIKTNGITMHYFGGIIKDRYNHWIKELLSEENFLKELLEKINNHLEKNEVRVSTYNLEKEVKLNIIIALENIEKFKKGEEQD